MPLVSVIVPTLNEERYLPRLLESLAASDRSHDLEVIISDGHSTDGTVSIARTFRSSFHRLSVVRSPSNIGAQRNAGARVAESKVLLFLDADVVVPVETADGFITESERLSSFVMAFRHDVYGGATTVDRIGLAVIRALIHIAAFFRVPVVNGDSIGVSRDVFTSIGGFREDLLLGEDTDFGLRATRQNARYVLSRLVIMSSARRVRRIGRLRLLAIWVYAYVRVLIGRPIRIDEGFHYPFGDY